MRLPPMNAVRAFDAVARLGSVRAAAEELAVTPAAVSQQMRVLEAHLGLALTRRDGRGIALTDAGRNWHGEIARPLRAIAVAAERVRPGRRVVQVTVVPSFGTRWLMPRLPLFTSQHPEIEVRIDASPALADLSRDAFDLAIREGAGVYPEAESVMLYPLEVLALASPAYLRMLKGKGRKVDWTKARLLHEMTINFWPDWLAAMGVQGVDQARGLYFSHAMMTLDAAADGQGVTLAPRCLAERELQKNLLVQVEPRVYLPGRGYYLAWAKPALRALSPAATAFRDWIIGQARTQG
ncbi:MAG: LysR substrate-binding domain-containing protein [Casimicrobiaceae bacterium]